MSKAFDDFDLLGDGFDGFMVEGAQSDALHRHQLARVDVHARVHFAVLAFADFVAALPPEGHLVDDESMHLTRVWFYRTIPIRCWSADSTKLPLSTNLAENGPKEKLRLPLKI